MAEKMRKRSRNAATEAVYPRNDKALNNQGFVVHKMAQAMGFELMGLLQSTVFKTVKLLSVGQASDTCEYPFRELIIKSH